MLCGHKSKHSSGMWGAVEEEPSRGAVALIGRLDTQSDPSTRSAQAQRIAGSVPSLDASLSVL